MRSLVEQLLLIFLHGLSYPGFLGVAVVLILIHHRLHRIHVHPVALLVQRQLIFEPLLLHLKSPISQLKVIYLLLQLELVGGLPSAPFLDHGNPLVAIFNLILQASAYCVEVLQLVLQVLDVSLKLGDLLLLFLEVILLARAQDRSLLHLLGLGHGFAHLIVGLLECSAVLLELLLEKLDVAVFHGSLLLRRLQLSSKRCYIGS